MPLLRVPGFPGLVGKRLYGPFRGRYSLIWLIRRCAAGQGMLFDLSVLNRMYILSRESMLNRVYRIFTFVQVCPNYK